MMSSIRCYFSFPRNSFTSKILLGSCLIGQAFAATPVVFPAAPGLSVTGLMGDFTTGYVDGLFPTLGQPTDFFYLDPQGLFHSHEDYSMALGLGARRLTDKAGIIGAYVFGDYNHAPNGHGFWFVSPGIERLGKRVDFSANLYIPAGSQQVDTGSVYGNQLGIYSGVSFSGHTEFDQWYSFYESDGMGGDVQIGYRLPVKNNTKVYLGGYYFAPKNTSSITGGTVRLEIPFTQRLSVDLSDGYDNFAHNTFKAGLTYTFVGRHTPMAFKGDLMERMVDPIQRNLIAVAGSAKTAQPILNGTMATDQYGAVMNNVSFFLPSPTLLNSNSVSGQGTYESPYVGLTQANVDSANAAGNTNLLFNGGLGAYTSTSSIDVTPDSIYGRQSYQGHLFVLPATGNNRPLLSFPSSSGLAWNPNLSDSSSVLSVVVSSIRFAGASNNTDMAVNNYGTGQVNFSVDNLDDTTAPALWGFSAQNQGVGAMNLMISNSAFSGGKNAGIDTEQKGSGPMNVILNNSSFSNNTGNGANGMIVYIFTTGALNITANNCNFDHNVFTPRRGSPNGSGMSVVNYSGPLNITVNNSTFNNNASLGLDVNNSAGGATTAITNVTANNSHFNNNGQDGLWAINSDAGEVNLFLNNSGFDSNGEKGVYTADLNNLTANNSTFNNNSTAGLEVNNNPGGGPVTSLVTTNQSTFNNNGQYGIWGINNPSGGELSLLLKGSVVGYNGQYGVFTTGGVTISDPGTTYPGNTPHN